MKKSTLIVLCSANLNRLVSRRCLGSLKATNLEQTELLIFDNNMDKDFSHPVVMEKTLRMAEKRSMQVIFLDDDVEIYNYNWIHRLQQAAATLDADIVSCVQAFDSGRINSIGEYLEKNGWTTPIDDFRHLAKNIIKHATYVPVLCSSIMLIRNPGRYHFDTNYKKYKQDLDVCLQAWDIGQRVGVALDMTLIHNRGFTGEQNHSFKDNLKADSRYFAKKWKDKFNKFRNLPELKQYNKRTSWRNFYNDAAKMKESNKSMAVRDLKTVVENCYIPRWVSGAFYHLYTITGDSKFLQECNRLNPCHGAARKKIESMGSSVNFNCQHANDCRICEMRRFGYVHNDIRNIINGVLLEV